MERIRNNSLFKGVSEEDFTLISKQLIFKSFDKSTVIFSIGDVIDSFFVIMEGQIEICNYDINGNKKLITVLNEGELFGESVALAEEVLSPYDIIAIKPLKVLQLTKEMLFSYPQQVLKNLLTILASKNTFLSHKLECHNKNTVRERIYEVLNYYGVQNKTNVIELPFNKTQLSEYLSVNRSSLSKELKLMQEEGIIQVNKHTYILNHKYFKVL